MAKNPKPLRKRRRGYMSVNETEQLKQALYKLIEACERFNKKEEN